MKSPFNRKILVRSILFLLFFAACKTKPKIGATWEVYGGSKENNHYSSLTQIDTANVQQLKIAWTFNTGDADTVNHTQIQCNPIVVDGNLYGTTPQLKLFSLDASTGRLKWMFNPSDFLIGEKKSSFNLNNCRGVTYWSDKTGDKRIFYATGSYLNCVDATSGKLVASFGENGRIDLHNGLGHNAKKLYVATTSPGIIYKDLIIIGTRVDEGAAAAPGHIRAFDVKTGAIKWIFHTIPQPGEYGYATWKDTAAYKHIGGANAWSGFSMDEKRGILFASTGSASYDFYGGKRIGDDLFADCLLAIDAATGKRIWHFQDIHHNVWDKDLPAPPALLTINKDGTPIDVVAQTTKTGYIFLFERETGRPIYPIVERPVNDTSGLTGEILSPTQPAPIGIEPFVRQSFTKTELNHLLPDSSYNEVKKRLAAYKNGFIFTPPSKEGTIIFPGYDGGAEWGGPAADPQTGVLYVNANEMAWILTMVDAKTQATAVESNLQAGARLYTNNCMSCHGQDLQGSGNFPSLLGAIARYNESTFYALLSSGRRMMPAFKQLSAEEKRALASFILKEPALQKAKFIPHPDSEDAWRNLPYTSTGYNRFLSKEGLPAIAPPWGTLNAINLQTGKIIWKDTLGDNPIFKSKGIHTGSENYGGPVVTAGGVLFIAATPDSKLRAYNKRTGQLLREFDLPGAAFATPSVYEIDGKQFVVIACGGGKLNTRSTDAYVAFSLDPPSPSASQFTPPPSTLKTQIAGFDKVVISSNTKGSLYRQFIGKPTPSFDLKEDDLKGRMIARFPAFPFSDTVPVILSQAVWRYYIKDEQGNIIANAETNPDNWPEHLLPELILPGHPDWITLYKKAWEWNWHRTVTSTALPAHFAYNATADNNMCYAWDACFNLLFQRYAAMAGADPAVATLDNYYAAQAPDGYIDRYFNTQTFAPGYKTKKDSAGMEGINPPLFAWAEWNYYLVSADKKRLALVLPKLIKHYEFIESFLQQKPGFYIWDGNPSGWDNILEVQKHKYWVELPAMQALAAQCIIKIADALALPDTRKRFATEVDKKRSEIRPYWNSQKSWYCSLDEKGGFTGKTLSGLWPVLAGIVPAGSIKGIVGNLMDTAKFLTSPMPLPVLAKDENGYDPHGKYWHGSVWINISLLTIRSLEENGYSKEARQLAMRTLDGMVRVYKEWQPKPGTLWECYAPEFVAPASHKIKPGLGSVRSDFADWTSCLINLIIENVMGIQIDAPANTITWSIRMNEEQGIKNLRFGNRTTDLVRKGSSLQVKTNKPYTLRILQTGDIRYLTVKPGLNNFHI